VKGIEASIINNETRFGANYFSAPEMFDTQFGEEGTYNYKITIYAAG